MAILGWAVGWMRNIFDTSLKYYYQSWVRAPDAAISQFVKLLASTFLTQPTAQPSSLLIDRATHDPTSTKHCPKSPLAALPGTNLTSSPRLEHA